MFEGIIGALVGYAICKSLGLLESGFGGLFHTSGPALAPAALPVVTHTVMPSGHTVTTPAVPQGGLLVTSTAAPFPVSAPAGLPPWPSGWKPARTTPDVISRAQVLLNTLPTGGSALEMSADSRWIRYQKSKSGTKTVVTAWEPKPGYDTPAPGGLSPASYNPSPVANAAPAGMPPTLKKGMKGQPIRDLQGLLHIPADGDFGPGTDKAVRVFQSSKGLKPDGIVGPATWQALRGAYAQA